jgi:hypothetical protein
MKTLIKEIWRLNEIKPKNGWIEVLLAFDKAEEQYEKSLVALPDDYKPLEKPYKAVSVVSDPEGE